MKKAAEILVLLSISMVSLGASVLLATLFLRHIGIIVIPPQFLLPADLSGGTEAHHYKVLGKGFRAHPKLGWTCWPNYNGLFSINEGGICFSIKTDEDGFRDRERGVKQSDVFRIVALGDSTTFGWGIDGEDSWPALLEGIAAPNLECVNLGISGFGTDQEFLTYHLYGKSYQSDAVVIAIASNDIGDVQEESVLLGKRPVTRPCFQLEDSPFAIPPINAIRVGEVLSGVVCLGSRRSREAARLDFCTVDPKETKRYIRGREILFNIVRRLKNDLEGDNCQLLILLVQSDPSPNRPERLISEFSRIKRPDLDRFFDDFEGFGRREEIPVINPRLRIAGESDQSNLFVPNDGHFNRRGNFIIAQAVLDALGDAKLWDSDNRPAPCLGLVEANSTSRIPGR